jgi:hypothetical protein
MLLDIVEVAKSHSGINLAAAFAKILDDFGISDKVSCKYDELQNFKLTKPHRSSASPVIMHQIMIR